MAEPRALTSREINRLARTALTRNAGADICDIDDLADEMFGFQVADVLSLRQATRETEMIMRLRGATRLWRTFLWLYPPPVRAGGFVSIDRGAVLPAHGWQFTDDAIKHPHLLKLVWYSWGTWDFEFERIDG